MRKDDQLALTIISFGMALGLAFLVIMGVIALLEALASML